MISVPWGAAFCGKLGIVEKQSFCTANRSGVEEGLGEGVCEGVFVFVIAAVRGTVGIVAAVAGRLVGE